MEAWQHARKRDRQCVTRIQAYERIEARRSSDPPILFSQQRCYRSRTRPRSRRHCAEKRACRSGHTAPAPPNTANAAGMGRTHARSLGARAGHLTHPTTRPPTHRKPRARPLASRGAAGSARSPKRAGLKFASSPRPRRLYAPGCLSAAMYMAEALPSQAFRSYRCCSVSRLLAACHPALRMHTSHRHVHRRVPPMG